MARKLKIEDIISGLSKEELIQLVTEVAERDEIFRNGLLVKYAKGDHKHQIQSCKKLVQAIVKKYVGRNGFITYRETSRFSREMLGLLEVNNQEEDDILALEIALLLLGESVEAFQYADDSGGDIGLLVDEALEQIAAVANRLDRENIKVREYVFGRLLSESKNDIFDGWEEYAIDLLRISVQLADTEQLREKLRTEIRQQIASKAQKEYQNHAIEKLQKMLFQLVNNYDSTEEAE